MSAGQPGRGAPNWDAIPPELAQRPQWLLWRFEVKRGQSKPLKVPYWTTGVRRSGVQGSDGDRAKLGTLEQARLAYDQGGYSGVGFAFLPGDGLIGIDIDGAIDLETGEVSQRLQAIIEAVASYTEYSPSGRGAHIIAAGETTTNKCNEIGLEIFAGRQYFTFTGNHWSGTPQTVQPIGEEALRRLNITVTAAKARRKLAPGVLAAQPGASDLRTRVESALESLSPDMGYNDWIAIGWALREAFGEFGFGLWSAWSARGDKYQGDGDLQSHWKSFACNRAPDDAVGVIFARARDAGWRAPRRAAAVNTADQGVTSDALARMDADLARFDALTGATESPPSAPPEWPDPILPGMLRTPPIPPALLPTWLGDMAHALAEATQTPPALAVMSGLAVLATVLQRRFEVAPYGDGYTEPLALWTLSASPSGTRKSAVLGAMLGPLVYWEKLLRDRMRGDIAKANAQRAVAKKRIERLQQDGAKAKDASERAAITAEIEREETDMPEEIRAPRLFSGDTTAERLQAMLVEYGERMAVHSDEAGIFLIMAGIYNGGAANLDVFLQGHAGSAMRVDRAGRSAHVDKPALSFGLLLQPGVLSEVASSRRFRDSGLLARFLYAMPASNVGTRDVRRHTPIPHAVRDEYERRLFGLLEGVPGEVQAPKVLPLSDPAREIWLDMAEAIEREQGDGGRYESISDWTSKLPGAVARVAALLELAEMGLQTNQVSLGAMERAESLARLWIPHAQAAFGLLGTDAADVDAGAIVKWLRVGELSEFTRREAQKAQEGRFRSVDRLQKALERLENQDVLREFKRHNKGAPPTTAYKVNPKVLST
jgi:putative DNA primase/helicase